jgi:hypothetical protein
VSKPPNFRPNFIGGFFKSLSSTAPNLWTAFLFLENFSGKPPVIHQPHVNPVDPPEGPQEEDDSGPLEEQQLEIIL